MKLLVHVFIISEGVKSIHVIWILQIFWLLIIEFRWDVCTNLIVLTAIERI